MQWFSTLEHELTHAIFAILSLNRVTGLNATGREGGVTHYQGYGNWVITLAPYFVPTVTIPSPIFTCENTNEVLCHKALISLTCI